MGAYINTNTILGVPSYNYGRIDPKASLIDPFKESPPILLTFASLFPRDIDSGMRGVFP